MCQLGLCLNETDKLEKINLSWNEIRNVGAHVFELYMLAEALELSLFLWPVRLAVLGWVLLASLCRDHKLESVCFILIELHPHFVSCLLESLAYSLTAEELWIERLREADCGIIEDCLALLAADDMRHIALLEYLTNEVWHASGHEYQLDLCHSLLQDLVQLTLANQATISIFCLKEQIALVSLLHQTHARISLIQSVARDVEASGTLANYVDEFVLRRHRLPESYVRFILRLIARVDGFNNCCFFLLKLESDEAGFALRSFDEYWARMQECYIDLGLFLVIGMEHQIFEIL